MASMLLSNMNMNTRVNIKVEAENKKIKKRVSFSLGTKEYDGQTEKTLLFCKTIMQYFNKGTIKNETDVYEIIKHEHFLIFDLLAESIMVLTKLNKLKKDEETCLLIKKNIPIINPKKYVPKDIEEVAIMQKWETSGYNISAHKKCNGPKGVPLAIRGSRIYSERLMTVHIPNLVNFIKILWNTYHALLNKKYSVNN